MADDVITIYNDGAQDSPNTYILSSGEAFIPTAVTAYFDGSGCADDFRACLSFYTQDGHLINRAWPDDSISAGSSGEVSYRPF